MTRRFLGISEPVWRVLITGAVTAIWMLVAWTATAHANDCAAYVNDPKNFTGNLQGLIEDCMRTGYVQAVATLLIGGIGGGVIAVGVNKTLKDAGKDWKDPNSIGTDDAGKKDGETPEPPPPTSGRDSTPEPCRGRWDDYRKATEEEFQKGKDLATVNNWYNHVVTNHMNNLAKVTIQLGMDAADLASAGTGAIKGGAGIAKAVANLPETLAAIKSGLARAIAHSRNLETLIYNLFVEIGQLSSKGARMAAAAEDAGRLSTRAEERIAEMVAGAAGLERDLAKYDELVRFSRTADSTLLERNGVSKTLSGAKVELDHANLEHQKILNRKKVLDDWAARERMAIANEDARAFANKHEELSNARSKLQQMQADNAEAAAAAHKNWQDKMGELSAAKKELEEARAAAGHLQKAKQNKLLAQQEVNQAAAVRDEARTRLEHAESELARFDAAAKEMEAAKARIWDIEAAHKEAMAKVLQEAEAAKQAITELEAAEEVLTAKLQTLTKAAETKDAFLKAEQARDLAADAVDAADANIRRLETRIDEIAESPALKQLRKQEIDAFNDFDKAREYFQANARVYMDAQGELGRVTRELEDLLEARNGIPPITPQESARLKQATKNMNDAQTEMMKAQTARDQLEHALDEAEAATASQKKKNVARLDAEGLVDQLAEAKQKKTELAQPLTDAQTSYDKAAHDLQKYSHPGIDLDAGPSLTAELSKIQSELPTKRYEAGPRVEAEQNRMAAELKAMKADEYEAATLPDKARIDYEHRVATAKADAAQVAKAHKDAETTLATAEEALKAADLSGTGEPLDALRPLEVRQARYDDLLREQDALRVKYEQLKSGGNSADAAPLKQRIDQLDAELAKWKDPDFDTEAARRNPEKFNEWKGELAGLDRIGESQAKITTLEARLSELETSLATVERKLIEQQQQAGGKSTADLEAEKAKLEAEIKTKQSAVDSAKGEKKTHDQAKAQAEKEKEQADTDRQKKEAEKQKAEEEKRQSDEDAARYKRLQDNPVPPPEDVSWLGQKLGVVLGKEWTPYHGSDAEGIANKSHDLRKKFDEGMDAITPDWLTWPFRAAGSKAGELFHKAFGGQSPEEVAAALKHGDKRVKEMKEKLRVAQEEFDALRAKAHQAKAALEACSAANQPATSAAESN